MRRTKHQLDHQQEAADRQAQQESAESKKGFSADCTPGMNLDEEFAEAFTQSRGTVDPKIKLGY